MDAQRHLFGLIPCAPALCLALCGCSGIRPYSASRPAPATKKADAHVRAKAKAQANAQTNLALQNLARAVQTWSEQTPGSGAPATNASAAKPLVWIDITMLAQRHPAWRLADSLERSNRHQEFSIRPVAASSVAARVATRVALRPESFTSHVRFSSFAPGAGATGFAPSRESELQSAPFSTPIMAANRATVIEASALPAALDVARRRQDNAFVAFLDDATNRQKDTRFDAAETLRAALDAQIAAERRATLEELAPYLPADEIGLELTNLRLRLLTATPAASVALQKRIDVLEAQWQARLREQEEVRQAELRELRRTRPAKLEREGNARIAASLAQAQRDDTALRASLRATHRALVDADFAANNGVLDIALPEVAPVSVLVSGLRAPLETTFLQGGKRPVSFETFAATMPSEGAENNVLRALNIPDFSLNEAPVSPSSIRTFQKVRQLRAQALRESQIWANAAAKRNGWNLARTAPAMGTNDQTVQDETARVMRLLNMR